TAASDAAMASTPKPASTAQTSSAPRRLVDACATVGEIRLLVLGQREVGALRPGFELGEARLAGQEVRAPSGLLPLLHCLDQPAVLQQVGAAFVDPSPQPVPLVEDGLVRDLDCRAPRHLVPVEREQPVLAETLEDLVEC